MAPVVFLAFAGLFLALHHCFLHGFETAGWHPQTSQNLPCSLPTCQNLQNSPGTSLLLLPAPDGTSGLGLPWAWQAWPPLFFQRWFLYGKLPDGSNTAFGTVSKLRMAPSNVSKPSLQPSYVLKPAQLSRHILAAVTCLRWHQWSWPSLGPAGMAPTLFGPPALLFVRFRNCRMAPSNVSNLPSTFQPCDHTPPPTSNLHLAWSLIKNRTLPDRPRSPNIRRSWSKNTTLANALALVCFPAPSTKKMGVGGTRALAHSICLPRIGTLRTTDFEQVCAKVQSTVDDLGQLLIGHRIGGWRNSYKFQLVWQPMALDSCFCN